MDDDVATSDKVWAWVFRLCATILSLVFVTQFAAMVTALHRALTDGPVWTNLALSVVLLLGATGTAMLAIELYSKARRRLLYLGPGCYAWLVTTYMSGGLYVHVFVTDLGGWYLTWTPATEGIIAYGDTATSAKEAFVEILIAMRKANIRVLTKVTMAKRRLYADVPNTELSWVIIPPKDYVENPDVGRLV